MIPVLPSSNPSQAELGSSRSCDHVITNSSLSFLSNKGRNCGTENAHLSMCESVFCDGNNQSEKDVECKTEHTPNVKGAVGDFVDVMPSGPKGGFFVQENDVLQLVGCTGTAKGGDGTPLCDMDGSQNSRGELGSDIVGNISGNVSANQILDVPGVKHDDGLLLKEESDDDDNRPMTLKIEDDIEKNVNTFDDDLVPVNNKNGGIRSSIVLWTWSHTVKEYYQSPFDMRIRICDTLAESAEEYEQQNIFLCKHIALLFSKEWDHISEEWLKSSGFTTDVCPKLDKIFVKPEYHSNGTLHLHILTCSNQRTRFFGTLQSRLKEKHGIFLHGRVSKSTVPFWPLYKYLFFPTDKKPLILPGYSVGNVPQNFVDKCEKEVSKMCRKQTNELGVDAFIQKYIKIIKTPFEFFDAMSGTTPPVLEEHDSEDPILLYRFKQVQSWYVKNASRNASSHVSSCYDRISRKKAITYRSMGPKDHFLSYTPDECIGVECQFQKAWSVMSSLNDLRPFIAFLKQWYTNTLPYGGPAFGGRPRNIVFHGQPGCGKSFLENILLYTIPEERIFKLKSGNFPFDGAADTAAPLVVLSSDFRFNDKMDVQTFLLATEGKHFSADNKGRAPSQVTAPLVFVMGSNNFNSGKGWGITDIEAAHDRFVIVNLHPIPYHHRIKNFSFCSFCAHKLIRGTTFSDVNPHGESHHLLDQRTTAKKPKHFLSQISEAKNLLDTGAISPKTYEKFTEKVKSEFFD